MAYQLPHLKYDYDALEPVIDGRTMRLHHDEHHRNYVEAINKAISDYPDLQSLTIEELLAKQETLPTAIREAVRNQGGGHANHQFFWKILTPGGSSMPEALEEQIRTDFGSVDAMKAEFEDKGVKHFGSGWVFLVVNPQAGKLEILTLPNQDSVLPLKKPGLLTCDLWEHAYYLQYQNRRADWLKAWWDVVHWAYVGERLQGVREGRKQL
jgi:superoxide dismutase, Fe-Mn family